MSYDLLDAKQQRLFRLLGLHPGADFDAYAAAALSAQSLRETERALEALVDAHLLETRTYARYTFHDLLRAHAADTAVQEEPGTERTIALKRLLDYYVCTADEAMDTYAPAERRYRPESTPLRVTRPALASKAESLRWLEDERPNLVASAAYAADHSLPEQASRLSSTLHRYLSNALYSSDGLTLHRSALRAARERSDRADEARALINLGTI